MDWKNKANKRLIQSILVLKTENEARRFLRDLMTESEIQEFASRLEAASLLSQDAQYATIIERTGLSSTTIARISKWLNGSLGGYRLILNRLASHHHNHSKLGKGLSLNS